MTRICLLLGSNIDKDVNIPKALKLLDAYVDIEASSSIYETAAVGCDGVPDFYNMAVLISTPWTVEQLKWQVLREIEAQLGRVRGEDPNAPRPIDIDIVMIDDSLVDDVRAELHFSHVVLPLAELRPDFEVDAGRTLAELAEAVDRSSVIGVVSTDSTRVKTVMVTGGAQRIGKALVLFLARRGFDVVLHYHRSEASALHLKALVEALGQKCYLVCADLRDGGAVEVLFEQLPEALVVDVLINSASMFEPDELSELDWALMCEQWQVNYFAPFRLTYEFAKRYQKGHVINVADCQVAHVFSKHQSYLLAKKALVDFTEMAAVSMAPDVTVNAVAPGWILDPVDEVSQSDKAGRLARVPRNCQGDVVDVCQAVWYLLESSFVTGQLLFVDGGQHL